MKLEALSAIKHDGEDFAAGDELPDMPKEQADALVASGAANAVKYAPAPAKGKGKDEGDK